MYKPPTLSDYFNFNRRERTAIITLICLIIITISIPSIHGYFVQDDPKLSYKPSSDQNKMDHDNSNDIKGDSSVQTENNRHTRTTNYSANKKLPSQPININLANSSDLAQLPGIGSVLSQRIIKFRDSKGGFNEMNEVKKVYGLRPETFELIKDHLYISKQPPLNKTSSSDGGISTTAKPSNSERFSPIKNSDIIVDINTAIAEDFMQLKGIGPTISSIIIKYRESKNGFDSISELKKIYGLEEEVFLKLLPQLRMSRRIKKDENRERITTSIDHSKTLNLDINSATAEELQLISGIGPKLSDGIVKLRERLGGFHNINQLLKVYALDDETLQKVISNVEMLSPHTKYNINQISFKELLGKGILEFEEVKYIFQLRQAKGKIQSEGELRSLQGISEEKLDELMPYLEF